MNYKGYEHDAEELASALSAVCEKSIAVSADVSLRADVQAMVDRTMKEYGRIDILINNAGISTPCAFLDIDDATWGAMIGVDLTALFSARRFAAA